MCFICGFHWILRVAVNISDKFLQNNHPAGHGLDYVQDGELETCDCCCKECAAEREP